MATSKRRKRVMTDSALIAAYKTVREPLDKERTFIERKKALRKFEGFLKDNSIKLKDVTWETMQEFFVWMQKSNGHAVSTCRQVLSLVKQFYLWAYESDKLRKDPQKIFTTTLKASLPKVGRKLPDPPTQEEMRKILQETSKPRRALVRIAYETGARVSELVSMQMSHLDLAHHTMKIQQHKQQTERIANLTTECTELLQEYIDNYRGTPKEGSEGFLWIGSYGTPISARTVQRWIKEVSRYAGREITPHKIRAACATHMLENEADIREVQVLLGWRALSTLEHYAGVAQVRQKAVFRKAHPLAKEEVTQAALEQAEKLKEVMPLFEQLKTLLAESGAS